jgi:hypothetical protein
MHPEIPGLRWEDGEWTCLGCGQKPKLVGAYVVQCHCGREWKWKGGPWRQTRRPIEDASISTGERR